MKPSLRLAVESYSFLDEFFSKKRRTFYFVERIKKESEILKGWPNKKCIDQTKILASLSAQSAGSIPSLLHRGYGSF